MSSTLDDLAQTLPNGFHDAELTHLSVDYARGEVRLGLMIWIGEMSDETSGREAYRPAIVTVSGLVLLLIDPPCEGYPFGEPGAVRIDGGPGQPATSRSELPGIPDDAFLYWFFVDDWNAFIRVAARHATLEWTGAPRIGPG